MALLSGEVAYLENSTHHLPGVELIFLYQLKSLQEDLAISGRLSLFLFLSSSYSLTLHLSLSPSFSISPFSALSLPVTMDQVSTGNQAIELHPLKKNVHSMLMICFIFI
jgi:hypothetical protein